MLLAMAGWGALPNDAVAVDYVKIPQDPTGGGFQAWPDVARLSDGRLFCTFYNGYAHGSPNNSSFPNAGRMDYSISSDEGHTWTTPQVLYDSPADDHDGSITQLKNGQLIVSFFKDCYDGYTGVSTPSSGVMTMTSNDLGRSWSVPRQVVSTDYYTSSPVRELSNGRLVLPIYYLKGSSAANGTAYGAVVVSDDQGTTWSDPKDIPLPPANEQQWLCAETDVIQLKDGSLYAAQRTNFDSMYFSTSTDFGETWSQSQAIGFNAHCPYLHRTSDDVILLAYRHYTTGSNAITALRYSFDECQTWSGEVVVDSVYGGAYPSIVDLKDGSELITYYEEGAGSNIRVKRFLATSNGIEWLPVTPMPEPGAISLVLVATVGLSIYTYRKKAGLLKGRLAIRLGA